MGQSLVTGGHVTNYILGTGERREWRFCLHSSAGLVLPRLTSHSVPGKHPIDEKTGIYIYGGVCM